MFDPSSFVNPTPLAHADASRDVLPRGGYQHLITELPLENAGKEQRPQVFTLIQHVTNSCYPMGQAVNQPEVLIGRWNCKLILKL
ncbi:hypothetical protein TNCV_3059011 [Trichonephila clavipes]|nr:hypothetical protein TNCV_3059011 [Trichonephila clavipes]